MIIWPEDWVLMYQPLKGGLENWIRENAGKVADCGFLVYDTGYFGIILFMCNGGPELSPRSWEKLQILLDEIP